MAKRQPSDPLPPPPRVRGLSNTPRATTRATIDDTIARPRQVAGGAVELMTDLEWDEYVEAQRFAAEAREQAEIDRSDEPIAEEERWIDGRPTIVRVS